MCRCCLLNRESCWRWLQGFESGLGPQRWLATRKHMQNARLVPFGTCGSAPHPSFSCQSDGSEEGHSRQRCKCKGTRKRCCHEKDRLWRPGSCTEPFPNHPLWFWSVLRNFGPWKRRLAGALIQATSNESHCNRHTSCTTMTIFAHSHWTRRPLSFPWKQWAVALLLVQLHLARASVCSCEYLSGTASYASSNSCNFRETTQLQAHLASTVR